MKVAVALIFAALLVSAAGTWAQPAADEQDSTTSEPQQNTDANADSGGAAADTTPNQPDRAPSDYRSSEQISEDLSVSFPVDI